MTGLALPKQNAGPTVSRSLSMNCTASLTEFTAQLLAKLGYVVMHQLYVIVTMVPLVTRQLPALHHGYY